MRNDNEAAMAIEKYADTVKRICFVYSKNESDTQDIFQNVFLKYVMSDIVFDSEEHEKAWIIRVTINSCKDFLKSMFRKITVPLEDAENLVFKEQSTSELLDVMKTLPQNYRTVLYLFYYEKYTAVEIANMMKKKTNTIYTWLSRAKELMKEKLGGEDFE